MSALGSSSNFSIIESHMPKYAKLWGVLNRKDIPVGSEAVAFLRSGSPAMGLC